MIDCNKCREMISCLLDGELDEEEQASVHEHIASCPECRCVYEAFCAISDEMREPEPLPEGLHDKIMSGVRAKAKKKSRTVWIKYFSAAACLALVILAGAKSGILNCDTKDFLTDAQTVSSGTEAYGYGGDESSEDRQQQSELYVADKVDELTAEKLDELLGPARGVSDAVPDACTAVTDEGPDYCLELPDGETLLIYFDLGRVYADFGDGAFLTSATAKQIRALLG